MTKCAETPSCTFVTWPFSWHIVFWVSNTTKQLWEHHHLSREQIYIIAYLSKILQYRSIHLLQPYLSFTTFNQYVICKLTTESKATSIPAGCIKCKNCLTNTVWKAYLIIWHTFHVLHFPFWNYTMANAFDNYEHNYTCTSDSTMAIFGFVQFAKFVIPYYLTW